MSYSVCGRMGAFGTLRRAGWAVALALVVLWPPCPGVAEDAADAERTGETRPFGEDQLARTARIMLASRAPALDVIRACMGRESTSVQELVGVMEALRTAARQPFAESFARKGFPDWWVPRAATKEALVDGRAVELKVDLLAAHKDFLATYFSGCDDRQDVSVVEVEDDAATFLAGLAKAGGGHCPLPSILLLRNEVARLALGWTRAFIGDHIERVGPVSLRCFDGLYLSFHAVADADAARSPWRLGVGAQINAMRKPVPTLSVGDHVLCLPELQMSGDRRDLAVSSEVSSWMVRYRSIYGASADREHHVLIRARIVTERRTGQCQLK